MQNVSLAAVYNFFVNNFFPVRRVARQTFQQTRTVTEAQMKGMPSLSAHSILLPVARNAKSICPENSAYAALFPTSNLSKKSLQETKKTRMAREGVRRHEERRWQAMAVSFEFQKIYWEPHADFIALSHYWWGVLSILKGLTLNFWKKWKILTFFGACHLADVYLRAEHGKKNDENVR